ncbi:WD repeat-containing protein 24 [Phlyctochytrium planicorne]|nr:WD repeat-containing protein 24 [Phlyctochytrium planicorne]
MFLPRTSATSHPSTPITSPETPTTPTLPSRPPPIGTTRFKVGYPISILTANPELTLAGVAGRDVLKVLRVGENWVEEVYNLRASGAVRKENAVFGCTDMKWGNAFCPSMIITSYASGDIAVWDLNRGMQKQERVISEHTTAVNRLSFHPTDMSIFLSASQDWTIKLWDLRTKHICRATFEGKAEGVRDVQFNPVRPNEFIAAFENGSIQKWDTRKPTEAERRLGGHSGQALTVDWNPDGQMVATAGRDKIIKVWDTTSESRKPRHHIQTSAHVARVRWRPTSVVGGSFVGLGSQQVASSALLGDARVLVWDLSRPFVPEWAVEEHDGLVTDFLWISPTILWSCSKDKHFIRQDLRHTGYNPALTLPRVAVAWNAYADVSFASTVDPVNIEDRLMDSRMGVGAPKQVAGTIESGTWDVDTFVELARGYCLDVVDGDIGKVCEINAEVAANANQHQTAQTWKMLKTMLANASIPSVSSTIPNIPDESRNLSQIFAEKVSKKSPSPHQQHHSNGHMWLDSATPKREPSPEADRTPPPKAISNTPYTIDEPRPPLPRAGSGGDPIAADTSNSDEDDDDDDDTPHRIHHDTLRVAGWGSRWASASPSNRMLPSPPVKPKSPPPSQPTSATPSTTASPSLIPKPTPTRSARTSGYGEGRGWGPTVIVKKEEREQTSTARGADAVLGFEDGDELVEDEEEKRVMDVQRVLDPGRIFTRIRLLGGRGPSGGNDDGGGWLGPSFESDEGAEKGMERVSLVYSDGGSGGWPKPRRTVSYPTNPLFAALLHESGNMGPDVPMDAIGLEMLKIGRNGGALRKQGLREVVIPGMEYSGIVGKLVKYYIERGDVQMCAVLGLILGAWIGESGVVGVEGWLWEYVELLRRFRLDVEAMTVMVKSNVPSLQARSLESTMVYTSCGFCQKAIPNPPSKGWACESCKRISLDGSEGVCVVPCVSTWWTFGMHATLVQVKYRVLHWM